MSLSKFNVVKKKETDKGQLGKWAEGAVRKELQDLSNAHLHFAFNRNLDARSAGGRFPAQAGDFQWFYDPQASASGFGDLTFNGIIEVKEVEHAFRLPFKNLDTDGYGRLRKRELAGSNVMVLVAHRTANMKPAAVVWRAFPLRYFANRNDVKGVGSWDLSDCPTCDYKEMIRAIVEQRFIT